MKMCWYYNDNVFESEHIGSSICFVYCITNLNDGKMYIGRKNFYSFKIKTINKKKKKIKVESDWKTYTSSSISLNEDILKYGIENFKKEILHLCESKGISNYLEAKEQFERKVLEIPDKFYNSIINCRVHRTHIKKLL